MTKAIIHPEHIIGTGRFIYMVIGRIPGDDDDTAMLVAAEDTSSASDDFRAALLEEEDLTDRELRMLESQYGDTVYLTGCHLVGEFDKC